MDAEHRPALSRRGLLRTAGAAGVVAAAVGGVGVAWADGGGSGASGGAGLSDAQAATAAQNDPIVVHVRDAKSGALDVFTGTSHCRVTDRDLAARLVCAVPGK